MEVSTVDISNEEKCWSIFKLVLFTKKQIKFDLYLTNEDKLFPLYKEKDFRFFVYALQLQRPIYI